MTTFNRAFELFEARGIDPEVAAAVGVTEEEDAIVYPNGRRRPFNGDRKMLHPSGTPLELWWLRSKPQGGEVLVTEGETDALAALTDQAKHGPADLSIASMPGSGYARRLPEVIPPGVQTVYLAFDGDEAGYKATEAAAQAFADDDGLPPEIRVVPIPDGMDLAEALQLTKLRDLLADAEVCLLESKAVAPETPEDPRYFGASIMDGAAFILTPEDERGETLWGTGSRILWVAGEPLLICASPGIGKTTIAQQVLLAMIGVREPRLLGYDVRPLPEGEKVLYIAADRPAQAVRSFRRMVRHENEAVLRDRVVVWKGPFPLDQAAEIAKEHGCSVVFMDTLAACATGDLSSDETGMKVYHALQDIVANGIDICVLHHNRKRGGQDSGWRGLDEVYGSRWITAPVGSVIYLRGKQGEDVHTLHQLKMPAAPVGPLKIFHNHQIGRTHSDNEAPGPSEEEREAIAPPPQTPPQPAQAQPSLSDEPGPIVEEAAPEKGAEPLGMSDPLDLTED